MPRLRNPRSGVVVQVDEATAARLGAAYESVEEKKTTKTPRKRTTKSDDD